MAGNRRTPGISAFSRNTITSAQYASHGEQLRISNLAYLQTQLSVFQSLAEHISVTHGKEIRSNPTFSTEFAKICNALGVDPSGASHSKKPAAGGRIGNLLKGQSGSEFYVELAIRIVEVCQKTRAENGGIMALSEVKMRAEKGRFVGGAMTASESDILHAVKMLEPLGGGYAIMTIGSKQMIRSIPKELNIDQAIVLEATQVLGYVSVSMLQINLRWSKPRAVAIIEDLLADGLLWEDLQTGGEPEFWSPAFIHEVYEDDIEN